MAARRRRANTGCSLRSPAFMGPETPRLLYYLRASLRLLLDSSSSTLLDIRRVLSDENYRPRLLKRCGDSQTKATWSEYNAKREKYRTVEIASLQNKVAALADPLPLRYVIGQPTSTINVRKLMDSGTTLVVDLSDMGDEPARLLGALLVSSFARAAEARANQAEELRKDYTMYVDEFQNFVSLAFGHPFRSAQMGPIVLPCSPIHLPASRGIATCHPGELCHYRLFPRGGR